MSRKHRRVLWSVSASCLALVLSQLPSPAWACWFGCCGGGCGGGGSTFAGRLMTPMRAAFGPPVVYESPMLSEGGCGSCGVSVADSCSSCTTSYAEPSVGECQPAPAQIESGKSPTLAEPKDRWKKKTYAPDEAPLGGATPESSGDSDAIRGGAGPAGSATETPANPPRGGIPADSEDSARSTFRPETPAPRTQTVPESEPRFRIEPRGSRSSTVPTPEESVTPIPSNRPATTEPAAPQPGQGRLSLPQASRLDDVVASGDAPARSRTVTRKPSRGGQLVRNAEYSRRPWNSETAPATVARHP